MVALSKPTLYVVRPQRPAHDRSDSRQTGAWGRMSVTHVSPLERHAESGFRHPLPQVVVVVVVVVVGSM